MIFKLIIFFAFLFAVLLPRVGMHTGQQLVLGLIIIIIIIIIIIYYIGL